MSSGPTLYCERRFRWAILSAIAGMLAAGWAAYFLPNYLLYKTPPIAADTVVVFGGNDFEERKQQARELIAEGRAEYIIVPFQGRIYEARGANFLIAQTQTAALVRDIRAANRRPYVEETHIEMLQAMKLMELIAAKRAIIVSSPYHMRRIEIMAARVFDPDEYQIAFVPTAFESPHKPWFASRADIKWVFWEWAKLIWFWLYSPFFSPSY